MTESGRFLVSVLATCLLLAGLYGALFVYQLGAPVAAEYWVPEAEVLKLHAAERHPGPKIVILGGSNALFGLDSGMIEQATHRYTVNLALHGGLSLDYLLAYASQILEPGDVVILSLEYGYFESENPSPSWFSSNVMAWDPRYFWRLPFAAKVDFTLSTPAKRVFNGALARLYESRLRRERGRVVRSREALLEEARTLRSGKPIAGDRTLYSPRNMSEHGDILNNTGSFYSEDPDSLPAPTFKYSARPWERLRHFQAECHRRGVRVFLSWPALPTRLGKNESAVRRYLEAIDAHAARLGLFRLGDPGDYRLDQRYFFNTIYHLNDEGRTIRTSRLLVHLQRHL